MIDRTTKGPTMITTCNATSHILPEGVFQHPLVKEVVGAQIGNGVVPLSPTV